jgi:hypothetical protein
MAVLSRLMGFPENRHRIQSAGLLSASWLFVHHPWVEWLRAGWERSAIGWTKAPVGGAVGFLRGAIAKSTEGEHPGFKAGCGSPRETSSFPMQMFLLTWWLTASSS